MNSYAVWMLAKYVMDDREREAANYRFARDVMASRPAIRAARNEMPEPDDPKITRRRFRFRPRTS